MLSPKYLYLQHNYLAVNHLYLGRAVLDNIVLLLVVERTCKTVSMLKRIGMLSAERLLRPPEYLSVYRLNIIILPLKSKYIPKIVYVYIELFGF